MRLIVIEALAYAICMRAWELLRSRKHLLELETRGAQLVEHDGMGLIVATHSVWFLLLGLEELLAGPTFLAPGLQILAGLLFLVAEVTRLWCMDALGKRWNVRVVVIPGAHRVRTGPYSKLRHPNYLAVLIGLSALPLALGLPYTALLILPLNAVTLWNRIQVENVALDRAEPPPRRRKPKPPQPQPAADASPSPEPRAALPHDEHEEYDEYWEYEDDDKYEEPEDPGRGAGEESLDEDFDPESAVDAPMAQRIRALRIEAGLSMEELAELVGTSLFVIARLEDDDWEGHSVDLLRRVAEAVGTRMEIRFVTLEDWATT